MTAARAAGGGDDIGGGDGGGGGGGEDDLDRCGVGCEGDVAAATKRYRF